MRLCPGDSILESPAMQRLRQFILAHRQQWATSPPEFERFEQELHEQIQAIECELLAAELGRYDVTAAEIEVAGVSYRPTLTWVQLLSFTMPVHITEGVHRLEAAQV